MHLTKIQHPFWIKKQTLGKPGIDMNFLNPIKNSYEKLIANIILKSERLNTIPKKPEIR